ncbi:MAG: hypothetical protein ABI324_21540, partial [Ktedonobacteraceae bacterium]
KRGIRKGFSIHELLVADGLPHPCTASLGVPVGPPARPQGLPHGCGKPNPYADEGVFPVP